MKEGFKSTEFGVLVLVVGVLLILAFFGVKMEAEYKDMLKYVVKLCMTYIGGRSMVKAAGAVTAALKGGGSTTVGTRIGGGE